MTTSPDFSLPFNDYGITREEIAVVVNNLDLLKEGSKALTFQED